MILAARPEREIADADFPCDLRLRRIVEGRPVDRVGHGERGVAGHEDGVGLVAVVGGHALGADLVRVDRVPPVLDDLAHARLGHPGLPAVLGQGGVVAVVDGQQHVALVGPHRPEPREPRVVHGHGADVAELDLLGVLEPFAHGDELLVRLRQLALAQQIGAVEEDAEGVAEGHHRRLALVVVEDDGVQAPFVGELETGDVVHGLQQLLPELAPVVVVPDDVVLVGVRGQRRRHLLDVDAVRVRDLDDLHTVLRPPLLHHRDRRVLDRVRLVADPDLLGRLRHGRARAQQHDGRGCQDELQWCRHARPPGARSQRTLRSGVPGSRISARTGSG